MKIDQFALLGVLAGIGAILVGNWVEGGHVASLMQGSAALIVFGGTLGAVLLSNRGEDLVLSIQNLGTAFQQPDQGSYQLALEQTLECVKLARSETLLAVQRRLPGIRDPFLKEIMQAVADGVEPQVIEDIFSQKIQLQEERLLGAAKVWTDAGGFAPTIGIIGAVLGLIHVMQNLTDTSKLGAGIAVAFVATVYGVGSANLLFLPLGNKLKKRALEASQLKQMMLEGGLCIVKGFSPSLTKQRMRSYFPS